MKNKSSQGFSFIEVLISLFILALVFLGLDAMEISALREDNNALILSIAVNQLISMTEILYAFAPSRELNERINSWNAQNKKILPKGIGKVTGTFPNYVITIYWGNVKQRKSCKQNRLGTNGCLRKKISI